MVSLLSLRIVHNHWSVRPGRLKLRAHLLDLSGLLFELCRHGFHCLLLLCDSRLSFDNRCLLLLQFTSLLFYLLALLKKLIKQHRVYLFVADAVRFSFFIAHDQIWVYFFNFLSHQPKLLSGLRIDLLLVSKGNRFQPQERFTGFIDRFDVVLEQGKSATPCFVCRSR